MEQFNASLAIQVLPKVEGEEVIRVVDEVIAYIKSTGLNTFVGPFETTIEGDLINLWILQRSAKKYVFALVHQVL